MTAELGGMTVAEMQSRMDGGEYQKWGVYFAVKAQRMELEQLQAAARRKRR